MNMMKKWTVPALAVLLALGAAGCSSAPAESTKPSSSVEESTAISANEPADNTAALDEVEKAFTDAGFTAENVAKEDGTLTMGVLNDNGTFQIAAYTFENGTSAAQKYLEEGQQLENNDYVEVNSCEKDDRQLRVLLNDYNNVYAIAALDREGGIEITVQDIPEPAFEQAMDVMKSLGYPAE